MFFTSPHTHTQLAFIPSTVEIFSRSKCWNIMYVTLTLMDIHFRLFLRVHITSTAEEHQGGWHSGKSLDLHMGSI
jgi:hypothetical protein